MELKIQAIHFNATEQLHTFIEKKVAKLEKLHGEISNVDVVLNVVKPETINNKSTTIHVVGAGLNLHTEKTCDTFEEGVDLCIDALKRLLEKAKEKKGTK